MTRASTIIRQIPGHRSTRETEFLGERGLLSVCPGVSASDLSHYGIRDSHLVMEFASPSSPSTSLCPTVGPVIRKGAEKPMVGVLARRVITGMADHQSVGDRAVQALPAPTMSLHHLVLTVMRVSLPAPEHAVAVFIGGSSPDPAVNGTGRGDLDIISLVVSKSAHKEEFMGNGPMKTGGV